MTKAPFTPLVRYPWDSNQSDASLKHNERHTPHDLLKTNLYTRGHDLLAEAYSDDGTTNNNDRQARQPHQRQTTDRLDTAIAEALAEDERNSEDELPAPNSRQVPPLFLSQQDDDEGLLEPCPHLNEAFIPTILVSGTVLICLT